MVDLTGPPRRRGRTRLDYRLHGRPAASPDCARERPRSGCFRIRLRASPRRVARPGRTRGAGRDPPRRFRHPPHPCPDGRGGRLSRSAMRRQRIMPSRSAAATFERAAKRRCTSASAASRTTSTWPGSTTRRRRAAASTMCRTLYRRVIGAYAAGVNLYVSQHRSELPAWMPRTHGGRRPRKHASVGRQRPRGTVAAATAASEVRGQAPWLPAPAPGPRL